MTEFVLRQMVRMSSAKQAEWPDIGARPGMIEQIDPVRRHVTVHWVNLGTYIPWLSFDDVEQINV